MDKMDIRVLVLRSLLAVIGAMEGVVITLLLFVLFPRSLHIAPSLFVLNSGFFTAYWSSHRMKDEVLAPYFVCVFAVVSVIVCLLLYGVTWLCVLNILGFFVTIAGCVVMCVMVRKIIGAAKEKLPKSGDQNENN